MNQKHFKYTVKFAALLVATLGAFLLSLNIWGQFMTLRPEVLKRDWPNTLAATARSYPSSWQALLEIRDLSTTEYVRQVNRIVHETLVHLRPRQIAEAGYTEDMLVDALNMRVPVWENYLLYALSYLKPDTYLRYEFCSAEKALERGIGECGQQSLTVVDLLDRHDIESGFIDWSEHHVVAVARTGPSEWYILDPDYNVAFPYRIDAPPMETPKIFDALGNAFLRVQPNRNVIRHPDGTREMLPNELYKSTGQTVAIGGPDARWGRACPIERVTYILKWVLPVLFFLPLAWSIHTRKRQ